MAKRKPQMQKPPPNGNTPPPRTMITKLSELAPRTGHVIIERPDGEEIAIPYKELTYKRFWEIARLVPDPVLPKDNPVDFHKDEKGELRQVFSVNWQEYQQAKVDAESRRAMWRLTEFVDLEFESATVEDRIVELQDTLSNEIVTALLTAMSGMMHESEARVESRSESFHQNGHSHVAHLPTNGVDVGALVKPE